MAQQLAAETKPLRLLCAPIGLRERSAASNGLLALRVGGVAPPATAHKQHWNQESELE